MARPIVITGFMGCGKSEVARALARRLNLAMFDLDRNITDHAGRTPAQLITEEGEPAFRAIESDVLGELLRTREVAVIALGGGAWIEKSNRDLIRQYSCFSVWLDVPFEVCWARIETANEDRPLGKTRDQAAQLYAHRRPIYQLSDLRIQLVGQESLEVIVSLIEDKLAADDAD